MKRGAQSLISELARQLGLPRLSLDESGCCALEFDQRHHLELRYVERADVFNLVLELGDLPAQEEGAALRWLAAANLDPARLGGCHFAFDARAMKIDLCRTLDAQGLGARELLNAIRSFVNVAKSWRSPATEELLMQQT